MSGLSAIPRGWGRFNAWVQQYPWPVRLLLGAITGTLIAAAFGWVHR